MYPTNYMNLMNNQPMSPDYGYNRMQQVQQMQQAINPTVPNMFGQMNQMNNMNQQQQTPYISAIPVTCLQAAQLQLGNLSQTQNIINAVRPFPQPAYITCSPYTSVNGFGCGNGCGIV